MLGLSQGERMSKACWCWPALLLVLVAFSGCDSKKADATAAKNATPVLSCLQAKQDGGDYKAVSQCIATGPSKIMSGTWVKDFETSWYFDGSVNVIDLSQRREIPSLLFGQWPLKAHDRATNDQQAFRVRFVGRRTAAGALVSAVLVDRLLSIQPVKAPSIVRAE